MNDLFLDRRQKLKDEGKFELPLNVDTNRYLIFNLSFKDIAVTSPFLIISGVFIYTFWKCGLLNRFLFFLFAAPSVGIFTLQYLKHPIRKNISYLQYGIIWNIKYKRRQKEFQFRKGEFDLLRKNDNDARKKIGIKNVFSDCYETSDNRFVRVIEVSSVNLSLLNRSEKRSTFEGYRTFITNIPYLKQIQICQIAQPVNMQNHIQFINEKTKNVNHFAKRLLIRSYKQFVEDIQKSRNLVTRKRYIVISQPIGSDREKALEEIDQKSKLVQTQIENMALGNAYLECHQLNNDELTKLLYTCIDYDNAQSLGEHIVSRASSKVDVTVGEQTARQLVDVFSRKLKENIN